MESLGKKVHLCVMDMISKLPNNNDANIHCIFKIPDSLRRVNPESFTPRLVAIGPLHHDNPNLKPMQNLKLIFLQSFIRRSENNNQLSLPLIIDYIGEEEKKIRYHYQDEIELSPEDFIQMILLDSIFIIELLIKKEDKDPMFENRWWFIDLLNDILLIENQIPLFIPHFIYGKCYCELGRKFSDLIYNFFKDVINSCSSSQLEKLFPFWESPITRHFTEYLYAAHIPYDISSWNRLRHESKLCGVENARDIMPSNADTVSKLIEYGVKFERGSDSLVEIHFDKLSGILKIPQIKVNEWTVTLFRNLVAFEQCQYLFPRFVTDYITFMDSLIDTPKDVKILSGKEIIEGDNRDPTICEVFNNLYKEAVTEDRAFYFAKQSIELNHYRRDRWHKWKATWYNWKLGLKRDYFNSPWSIISLIAAVILLALTVIQTVCSIYQAKGINM